MPLPACSKRATRWRSEAKEIGASAKFDRFLKLRGDESTRKPVCVLFLFFFFFVRALPEKQRGGSCW